MAKQHNPKHFALPTGPYSFGVEIGPNARWLHTAGQIGVKPDGSVPEGVEAQAKQAWENMIAVLASAGMTVENLVKVTAYLVKASDAAAYGKVRTQALGTARPASTLVIVSALARPEWLVEIEGIAAKE